MTDIGLIEYKILKTKLEIDIMSLVSDFNSKTGTEILALYIDRSMAYQDKNSFKTYVKASVDL